MQPLEEVTEVKLPLQVVAELRRLAAAVSAAEKRRDVYTLGVVDALGYPRDQVRGFDEATGELLLGGRPDGR